MSRFNLLANSRHGNGPLWGFVLAPGAKRHWLIVMTDQRPFAFGDWVRRRPRAAKARRRHAV